VSSKASRGRLIDQIEEMLSFSQHLRAVSPSGRFEMIE